MSYTKLLCAPAGGLVWAVPAHRDIWGWWGPESLDPVTTNLARLVLQGLGGCAGRGWGCGLQVVDQLAGWDMKVNAVLQYMQRNNEVSENASRSTLK